MADQPGAEKISVTINELRRIAAYKKYDNSYQKLDKTA